MLVGVSCGIGLCVVIILAVGVLLGAFYLGGRFGVCTFGIGHLCVWVCMGTYGGVSVCRYV